jgi:hypothetical protein
MSDKELIRGKVARILNSRELVLNIGSNHGVAIGMKFDVLDPKAENITDPDSGEILGSIYRPKVRVKVISVQERLCLASTFKKWKENEGGTGGFLFEGISNISSALMPPKWVTRYETLRTDESTWEDLEEEASFVKTGDPVVQIIESENGNANKE